jgi:hypothetical protein
MDLELHITVLHNSLSLRHTINWTDPYKSLELTAELHCSYGGKYTHIPEPLLSPEEHCVINSLFLSFLTGRGITKHRIPDWGWYRSVASDRPHWKTSEQNMDNERKTSIRRRRVMLIKTHHHHVDDTSLISYVIWSSTGRTENLLNGNDINLYSGGVMFRKGKTNTHKINK